MSKTSKLTTAVRIAKCVDKLFDNLVEEKLLDKDNDIVGNIKVAKDSFKKTMQSFNEAEEKEKPKKPKSKSKSKKKAKIHKTKAPEMAISEASV